mmetsp:Transcript_7705/g.13166  ORF Transcript_7705/g.13166 Transcript_7705/m.13166 type:complete len:221 (-) Transcript_7705:282-944(-)
MASIQQALVAGVAVSGGHGALDDAELLIEDLNEGCEAVCGARGIADNVVSLRVVVQVVDTNDVGGNVSTLARGSDDDLLGTSLDVLAGSRGVNEDTSGLNNNVNAKLLPWGLQRVTSGNDLEGLRQALNSDHVTIKLDVGSELAEDGVVLEEVSSELRAASVIHSDELEIGVFPAGKAADHVTADTAETVHGNLKLHGHGHHVAFRAGSSLRLDGGEELV